MKPGRLDEVTAFEGEDRSLRMIGEKEVVAVVMKTEEGSRKGVRLQSKIRTFPSIDHKEMQSQLDHTKGKACCRPKEEVQ